MVTVNGAGVDTTTGAVVVVVDVVVAVSVVFGVSFELFDGVSGNVIFFSIGIELIFDIKDSLFFEERNANNKHSDKKQVARIVVALTKKLFVLAPRIDSAEAKCSVNPPPRPDCIRIMVASNIQIMV